GEVAWTENTYSGYGPDDDSGLTALTPETDFHLIQSLSWQAKYIDPTDLYYNGFRYYDPTTKRFISADPLGRGATPDLYGYTNGDPINYVDPMGLDPEFHGGDDPGIDSASTANPDFEQTLGLSGTSGILPGKVKIDGVWYYRQSDGSYRSRSGGTPSGNGSSGNGSSGNGSSGDGDGSSSSNNSNGNSNNNSNTNGGQVPGQGTGGTRRVDPDIPVLDLEVGDGSVVGPKPYTGGFSSVYTGSILPEFDTGQMARDVNLSLIYDVTINPTGMFWFDPIEEEITTQRSEPRSVRTRTRQGLSNPGALTPSEFAGALRDGAAGALSFWERAIVDSSAPGGNIISFIEGAGMGSWAFVDGVIPFFDPFEKKLGLYDSASYGLSKSQVSGALTRDIVLVLLG
ncbi:MAG: RHS repeat-associated core domain-containing protein, partial [Bacteroidota bacterium]